MSEEQSSPPGRKDDSAPLGDARREGGDMQASIDPVKRARFYTTEDGQIGSEWADNVGGPGGALNEPLRDVRSVAPVPFKQSIVDHAKAFLKRHEKKLWWLHSVYALCLGMSVVFFAQRGFEKARILSVSVGAAWLLVVLFFRVFAKDRPINASEIAAKKPNLRFYAMTYALKNLYQGMLFFLVPFYFKASTYDSPNFYFVVVLGAFAILSTLDIVFDRFVMRFRTLASFFHGLTLFACLNLVVPALFPNTRTLVAVLAAAGLSVLSFFTLHLRWQWLKRPPVVALLALAMGGVVFGVYAARAYLPPVPMYVSHAAVGPAVREDGHLTMEVSTLDVKALQRLVAVTDITLPGGKGDRLVHVWKKNGETVFRSVEETSRVPGATDGIRLRSTLSKVPEHPVGQWTVDVETDDGQLVGRTRFAVVE